MNENQAHNSNLSRQLGLLGLTATGICSMIGASIYIVPIMIQRNVSGIGDYVLPAFVVAAIPALLAAFVVATLILGAHLSIYSRFRGHMHHRVRQGLLVHAHVSLNLPAALEVQFARVAETSAAKLERHIEVVTSLPDAEPQTASSERLELVPAL